MKQIVYLETILVHLHFTACFMKLYIRFSFKRKIEEIFDTVFLYLLITNLDFYAILIIYRFPSRLQCVLPDILKGHFIFFFKSSVFTLKTKTKH